MTVLSGVYGYGRSSASCDGAVPVVEEGGHQETATGVPQEELLRDCRPLSPAVSRNASRKGGPMNRPGTGGHANGKLQIPATRSTVRPGQKVPFPYRRRAWQLELYPPTAVTARRPRCRTYSLHWWA